MSSPTVKFIILLLILLTALAVRILPDLGKKIETGILFVTPDPFYHARRTEILVKHFPHFENFDYYISYPTGAYCIWPPLYDYLIAGFIWLIFKGQPTTAQLEWTCALYPVFYGLVFIFLTYLIARKLFNETIALFATYFTSLMPGLLAWSQLGYNDHHIVEALSLLLLFGILVSNLKTSKRSILLGFAMGFALLSWQGSILFCGLVFLILFLFEDELPAFWSFFLVILAILPFSLNNYYIGGYFSYRGLSLLHIVLLGYAMMVLLLKYFVRRREVAISIMLGGIIIITFFLLYFKYPSLTAGLNFIFKKNPWHKTIIEFQPMYEMAEILVPQRIHIYFGRGYYFWPIMLGVFILNGLRKSNSITISRRAISYFTIFTIFAGVMSLFTLRYTPWFVPFYAMLFSYFLYEVYKFFKGKFIKGEIWGIIIVLLLTLVNFKDILISYLSHPTTDQQVHPFIPQINACYWLRDSTEVTSYYSTPIKRPEYGVMCFWDEGHYIVYLAKRPVTASNFGDDVPNFNLTNMYYLTETEKAANEIIEGLNCKYIHVIKPHRVLYLSTKYLGMDVKKYLNLYYVKRGSYIETIMEPNEQAVSTTIMRLFVFHGSGFYHGGRYYEPYRHYQLRYFSPDIMIYKYVKGAVITGQLKNHKSVVYSHDVKVGRLVFTYQDSVTVDSAGHFYLITPYPGDSTAPHYLKLGNKKIKFFVSAHEVENGDTIKLDHLLKF
ncbi:MAG: STT3 domain-containing protein [candidate division WOR-3 bacterium]